MTSGRRDAPERAPLEQGPLDLGLTHIALQVADLDRSLEFYAEFADLQVVHRRGEPGEQVAWISDLTRPFVVVLIEHEVDHPLGGWAHLGVGVDSREAVEEALARAASAGHATVGPLDSGPPVGFWGMIIDPDGHNLELSYGQEVGLTVDLAASDPPA